MSSKIIELGFEKLNIKLNDLGLSLTIYDAEYGQNSKFIHLMAKVSVRTC